MARRNAATIEDEIDENLLDFEQNIQFDQNLFEAGYFLCYISSNNTIILSGLVFESEDSFDCGNNGPAENKFISSCKNACFRLNFEELDNLMSQSGLFMNELEPRSLMKWFAYIHFILYERYVGTLLINEVIVGYQKAYDSLPINALATVASLIRRIISACESTSLTLSASYEGSIKESHWYFWFDSSLFFEGADASVSAAVEGSSILTACLQNICAATFCPAPIVQILLEGSQMH